MADYYPLIARAVAGLDPSASGESRRALYERARTALITQLRGVEPALSEAEITRERLALEEAVRKVEAAAAQRPRGEAASSGKSPSDSSRADAPRTEPSRTEPPRGEQPRRPTPDSPRENSLRVGPPPIPREENVPPDAPRRGDALRESTKSAAARSNLRGDPAARPPRGTDSWDDVSRVRDGRTGAPAGAVPPAAPGGVRGFRDVVADTDDLGRAAAQANRAARKTYANVPSPSPEFERSEPDMEQRGAGPGDQAAQQPGRRRMSASDKPIKVKSSGGFPLKTTLALGAVLIGIGGALLFYQNGASSLRAMFTSKPVAEAPVSSDATTKPKITDRVGQSGSSQPIAPIAQRAILYEEDAADPQGKQTVGTVVWRVEQIAPSARQKPDTAIRAEVDLPDRKMKMMFTLMRNTDPSMPATSHTIEVVFTTPPDFGTTVANVPGIYAKSPDQPRGTPLAATSVKVQDGYFLIGLSNVDVDRDRNIQILKDRTSLDIPMVYGNGKRAILSLEKGSPGERAFRDAFAAWGQ